MDRDYHVHSTYSDGSFLSEMVRAAVDAGLSGVGIADHCSVTGDEERKAQRDLLGFALDLTHERRRAAIEQLRREHDVEIYDAVEMDYHRDEEERIAAFLSETGFQYAVGSVHHLEGVNVHVEPHFAAKSESDRETAVERYFEKLIALVESELFAIAAHPDLVERNPALRGYATEEQYHRVAEAFADSRTVPELNAGRVLGEYGQFHPRAEFLDVLAEHDVSVTVGTDAHAPGEIGERVDRVERYLETRDLEPTELSL